MALQSNYYPVPIVAGTTAGTYAAGDDPRLSDERTPPDDAVTNAKLANVATATIKGRATAGTGDPEDLTASQVRTILNVADGAEVNVQSNWTEADSGSDAFILNKPSIPTASSATPQSLGVAAAGTSSDFARADHVHVMPSAADVGAVSATQLPLDGGVGAPFNEGDFIRYDSGSGAFVVGFDAPSVFGNSAAANIGTGAGDVCAGDDARLSDARTPTSHTHGNITNDGKLGSTAGLPIKTGAAGVIEAGAFGVNAGEFAEGNHTHTQLHDRSHAITSTSDHTAGNHKVFYSDGSGEIQELALGNSGEVLTSNGASAAPSFAAASGGVSAVNSTLADILSVSGSDLVADDLGADKLYGWDDSASKAIGFATVGPTFDGTTLRWPVELVIACSDETSDLTTGTAKVTFRAPYAFLLTGVRASVNTAPTGSTLIVDINNGANSALSTKLSIDASEKTSTTAASAAVIDTTYDDFSDDAEITIDIDQIGSTVAGKGLKVTLIGTRA